MKSTKTAAVITLLVVILAALLGSCRSLNAERDKALTVFEHGEFGDGIGVKSDLERRAGVCANLCTVAGRNGMNDEADQLAKLVARLREGESQTDLLTPAYALLDKLEKAGLDEKDKGYLSGFRAELDSTADTIRRDLYTQMAQTFNERTLTAFPAGLLSRITGVKPLPIYT